MPGNERRDEKAPHDASVFVGSLPLNIDHGELGKMLAEHLSEHTQVKNIKVIRDSKGGICAFVQCENADAASGLIQTLRTTTPKPFLGRILRYEPARAFRTLLVSYRAPSYLIPGYGSPGRQNPWELPTALRLWKTKGSRFHHIAYNSDAEVAELRRTEQKLDAAESNSLHLQPLKFDEFSLHKLAAYFGRLESFALYRPEEDAPSSEVPNVGNAHPGPHSAPRLPCMDNGCWEVKWDFRDDCVGALMALRRVPHLTVTWAHLPFSSGGDLHLAQFKHPQYFQPAPYSHQASPLLPPFPYSTSPTAGVVSQSGYNKGDVIKPHQEVLVVGPPQDFRNQAHIPLVTVGWAPPSKSELMPSTSFKPVVAFTDMTAPPIDVYEWPSYTIEKQRATEERHHSACYPQSTASPIVRPTSGDDPQIVYPLTPTSWAASDDDHLDAPQKSEDMRDAEAQNIDPTSLFIGGLNVLGSFPWTEERVREHFSKYGGLENVKFVRPFNATTAFAFLKYNNTEGPARAVQEEHNRTCDGRVLRVQLRDCNPPRNPWKNGRGRGRFPTNHSFSHRGHHFPTKFVPRSNCLPKESAAGSEALSNRNEAEHPGTATSLEGSPSPYVSEASPTSDDRTLHDATPSPSLAASDDGAFKGSASSRSDAQDHSEKYREWYDDLEPTTNHTWLPSSASMNTIPPPGYPCVYPNGPFYTTPTTWVPTQVYQAPYPMPYYPVCPGMHPSQALPPQGDYDPNWSASAVVYQPNYYYPRPQPIESLAQGNLESDMQPQHAPSVSPEKSEGVNQGNTTPTVNPAIPFRPSYNHSYVHPGPGSGPPPQPSGWHSGQSGPNHRMIPVPTPLGASYPPPPAYTPTQGPTGFGRALPPGANRRQGHRPSGQRSNHHHRSLNNKNFRPHGDIQFNQQGYNGTPPINVPKGKHHLTNR